MNESLTVLLIEDQDDDVLLIEDALRRGGFEVNCTRIETAPDMERALKDGIWDVIVSDYSLPHFDGMSAYRIFKDSGLDIPFIIVSGTIGEETAVAAMKVGVQDYIMKGNLTRLAPAVRREMRDAAERKARQEAEDRLKQTERLRLIGESMASLVHDLNNPLQVLLGLAEILKCDDLTVDDRTQYLNELTREIEHILEMRTDFLDFTRKTPVTRFLPVNLAQIVRELVTTYARVYTESGIALECVARSARDDDTVISGEHSKVRRILHNLVSNAKDALPHGGRICVTVDATTDAVELEVSDDGSGIPAEVQEKMFKPFVTYGKSYGTGLGLALVQQFVEALEGSITFVTGEHTGTTFTMKFPRLCAGAPATGSATVPRNTQVPSI